jgi:hypothetical protein
VTEFKHAGTDYCQAAAKIALEVLSSKKGIDTAKAHAAIAQINYDGDFAIGMAAGAHFILEEIMNGNLKIKLLEQE